MDRCCESCKHWELPTDARWWGACRKAESVGGEPTNGPTMAVAYAVTDDGKDNTGGRAELATPPTFGCVQWESKP